MFAVIFEVKPKKEGNEEYLETTSNLREIFGKPGVFYLYSKISKPY